MKRIVILFSAVIITLIIGGLFTYENGLVNSSLSKIYIESQVLHKKMPVNIYLPKGYSKNKTYPVLYLLHGFGLGDTEDQWLPGIFSKELIDEMIEQKDIESLIVVSPLYGASSGYDAQKTELYKDKESGLSYGPYETYVVQELLPSIQKEYSLSLLKEDTYIGGFSGGANTALYYAITYPDRFGKIGLFCPALDTPSQSTSKSKLSQFLYPTEELRAKRDPLLLIDQVDFKNTEIFIEAPKYDKWTDGVTTLHEILVKKGITHTFISSEELSHSPRALMNEAKRYLDFFSK